MSGAPTLCAARRPASTGAAGMPVGGARDRLGSVGAVGLAVRARHAGSAPSSGRPIAGQR